MTLAQAPMDKLSRISGYDGLSEETELRLSSLGLRVGSEVVKLIKTPLRDPVECRVGPQLMAIETWLLDRILVE